MKTIIQPPPTVSLTVSGSEQRFPVQRIFCVGRNYADHAREMGGDPQREAPFFFSKFASAVAPNHSQIAYPAMTAELHHEVELVVAIGKPGATIAAERAREHIFGYAVGLDLTRRDLQTALREQGRPWDMAKNFAQSAPIGTIHPVSLVGHPRQGTISLDVDGERRQSGDLADMIWNCEEVIAHLSQFCPLQAGDVIMTGTPSGVSAVEPGQTLNAQIHGLEALSVSIAAAQLTPSPTSEQDKPLP